MKKPESGGMRVFFTIWFGQVISLIGSSMTGFALSVWVYKTTGSILKLALVLFFTMVPAMIVSPLAGALVDRWDRRKVMILSDVGASIGPLTIALLFMLGALEIWHIYVALTISSMFVAFQWPAFSAATTLLVPKKQIGRASGLAQFAQALSLIAGPPVAALLMATVDLYGVFLLDVFSFLFSVTTLLLVRFPRAEATVEGKAGSGSLLYESFYGWTYIKSRPGLLGLLLFFVSTNFIFGLAQVLFTPLVLSFASVAVLGTVQSILGLGMLVGGIAISLWGGTGRRVMVVLGFQLVLGLCILAAGLRPSVYMVVIPAFIASFSIPIIWGSSQAIWQLKVAPDLQGRVFAVRRMIAWSALPLAYISAGPLAEYVFEPLLTEKGPLASSVGLFMGVGRGRGTGLLLVVMGLINTVAIIAGYMYPRLRLLEEELPDAISDNHGSIDTIQSQTEMGREEGGESNLFASSEADVEMSDNKVGLARAAPGGSLSSVENE